MPSAVIGGAIRMPVHSHTGSSSDFIAQRPRAQTAGARSTHDPGRFEGWCTAWVTGQMGALSHVALAAAAAPGSHDASREAGDTAPVLTAGPRARRRCAVAAGSPAHPPASDGTPCAHASPSARATSASCGTESTRGQTPCRPSHHTCGLLVLASVARFLLCFTRPTRANGCTEDGGGPSGHNVLRLHALWTCPEGPEGVPVHLIVRA